MADYSWAESFTAIVLYRGAVTVLIAAVITIVACWAVVFMIETMEARVRAFRRWLRP